MRGAYVFERFSHGLKVRGAYVFERFSHELTYVCWTMALAGDILSFICRTSNHFGGKGGEPSLRVWLGNKLHCYLQ